MYRTLRVELVKIYTKPLFTVVRLEGHRSFDRGVGVVALQREVLEAEVEDRATLGVEVHGGQRTRRA